MTIQELHEKILSSKCPPYDERLGAFMDEQGYERYKTNTGHTYYLYLAKLVREVRPGRVVELGTDIGRSGAFIMTQLGPEARFITIEAGCQRRRDLDLFMGDPRLKIVTGNSIDPEVYGPILDVDFLFIDTDHTYEQISKEWKAWSPRLAKGAVVAMDDIHLNEGMERFWNELDVPKVDCGREIHESGWGIAAP
jgi:predicted O-methyltransferase YrrM